MSVRRLSDDALAVLEGLVGSANLRESPDLLVAGVRPGAEVLVEDVCRLEDVLKVAAEFDLAVCPTGGSTKLGWGAPPRSCDLLVRTAPWSGDTHTQVASRGTPTPRQHSITPLGSLAAITEYDPDNLIVTAGAGVTVAALGGLAAQDGLLLPLDPPTPESATLGGVVSTNDHGPHRLLHGSMRDVVLGLSAVLVGGERVKAGGRTMKNVTGYDLTRLFVGSFGSLGIVSEATIRLLPGPVCEQVVAASLPDLDAVAAVARGLLGSQLVPAAVEMLSPSSSRMLEDLAVGIGEWGSYLAVIAFEGDPVAVEREVRDTLRLVGEGSTILLTAPGPVAAVWSALSKQRESARSMGYVVEVKLSVPLSHLWEVLDLVRSGAEAADGAPMWTASAGSGTARIWLRCSTTPGSAMLETMPAESVALLVKARAAAEHRGGSLVVVDGGQALGPGFGAWGSDPSGVAVMRALKSKFDPRGLMNPGRSPGGL